MQVSGWHISEHRSKSDPSLLEGILHTVIVNHQRLIHDILHQTRSEDLRSTHSEQRFVILNESEAIGLLKH